MVPPLIVQYVQFYMTNLSLVILHKQTIIDALWRARERERERMLQNNWQTAGIIIR